MLVTYQLPVSASILQHAYSAYPIHDVIDVGGYILPQGGSGTDSRLLPLLFSAFCISRSLLNARPPDTTVQHTQTSHSPQASRLQKWNVELRTDM